MMTLQIDHVTIAGSSLADMEQTFSALGLTPIYGGPHSNGVTHMSLVGFSDGSYIELISFLESTQSGREDTAFWGQHIANNGGPCAWAVYVDDVAAEAGRMANLGVSVGGPHYYNRRRPDGTLIEWDLAFLGNKGAGATLPFIIKDITPRSLRVQPSDAITSITGIDTVILGVDNPVEAAALFQNVYHWPAPRLVEDYQFGAVLARFADTPVTLASSLAGHPWLAARLNQFGDSPCGYLLAATDFEAACRTYALIAGAEWFGRRVAWFNPDQLNGLRLGIID